MTQQVFYADGSTTQHVHVRYWSFTGLKPVIACVQGKPSEQELARFRGAVDQEIGRLFLNGVEV